AAGRRDQQEPSVSEQRVDRLALAGTERDVPQPPEGGIDLGPRRARGVARGVRHEGLRLRASIHRSIFTSRMLRGIAPKLVVEGASASSLFTSPVIRVI